LECRLCGKVLECYRPIPIRIGWDFQPRLAEGDEGTSILSRLSRISKPLCDPEHPVWEEMAWLERKIRELNLGKVRIMDVMRNLGKWRLHYLRLAPLYFKVKLSGMLKGHGEGL